MSLLAASDDTFENLAYAVHHAVIEGDVRSAHVHLRKDPEAATRYNLNGLTPLHILVIHYGTPHFDKILELLKLFKADLRQPVRAFPRDNVLHLAVRYVKQADLDKVVQKLCLAGAESLRRMRNDERATPWELAQDMGLSQFCERLKPGNNFEEDLDEPPETLLARAICEAKFDEMKDLIADGADVFRQNKDDDTVLHLVATRIDPKDRVNGHVYSSVTVVLMMGADVMKMNRDRQTPIDIAQSRGLLDLELLFRQADLTFEPNEFQPNQTSRVVTDKWRKVIETARKQKQNMQTIAKQVRINDQNSQEAAPETDDRRTREGKTVPPDQQPLLIAVKGATQVCNSLHEFRIFISELVRLGANLNLVNSDDGNNCLHYAVMSNQSGVVDMMMRMGVETKLKNKEGKTPLELARQLRYQAIEKLLNEFQSQKPLDDWGKLADQRCAIL